MKEAVRQSVAESQTLDDVRDSLFKLFRELREDGHTRIGYVSGAITADGRENIPHNLAVLEQHTEEIRAREPFPIFSPTDVFDDMLFERLDAAGFVNADWEKFWDEVLYSEERFVTDMFMTPRWERSSGAKKEHKVALKAGMTIVYESES